MIELKVHREHDSGKQTLSSMMVYKNDIFRDIFSILEPAWKNNQINISCIPKGTYIVKHYSSAKYPDVFEITNVEGRTYILIHSGNYRIDTKGCQIIGRGFRDINKDGLLDVIYSKGALHDLRNICKGEDYITMTID